MRRRCQVYIGAGCTLAINDTSLEGIGGVDCFWVGDISLAILVLLFSVFHAYIFLQLEVVFLVVHFDLFDFFASPLCGSQFPSQYTQPTFRNVPDIQALHP
jgi:hypothetical protein